MNRLILFRLLMPTALLLVGVAALLFLVRDGVEFDSSARALMASDSRSLETFEKVEELIPDTTMVMAALRINDLFSDHGAGVVALASARLLSVPGCEDVKSLTHSSRPVRNGFSLDIEALVPRHATPRQWQEIRDFITRFPLTRNTLVSEDGRYAVAIGVYRRNLADHDSRVVFRNEILSALVPVREKAEAVHVLSFPMLEVEGYEAVTGDLAIYAAWAAILIVALLLVSFRSLSAVFYVLTAETVSVLLLFLVFQVLRHPIDVYTGILFPLVCGLQLTFVVHYLAALQRFARTEPAGAAGALALREVLGPSALAALTTVLGLTSLAMSSIPVVAAFGRIGALAVTLVFLATFITPLITTRWTDRIEPHGHGSVDWGFFPVKRRRVLLLLSLAGCFALSIGLFRIRTDIRAAEFIKKGHPVREALELLNDELGGTNIFQVRIDTGRPKGLQSPVVLAYMEELRRYAYTLDGVTDAYAYSQLYIGLDQIWEGNTDPQGKLPTNPMKLALYSQLINSSSLLFEESFVIGDSRGALLVLRSRDMPGEEYLGMLQDFMAFAERTCPAGVTLEPVKGLHSILEGNRKVVHNQIRTLAASVAVIALTMGLLWRSLRLALCVGLANLPALVAIFGVMGYTGTPLNAITVMVTAVILGIAVDDGIHLVSHYRHGARTGTGHARAIALALQAKLKPMACTSSILIVFLGLLLLTSFPPVAHFGALGAVGLATAFLGAVVLLPALLSLGHLDTTAGSENRLLDDRKNS